MSAEALKWLTIILMCEATSVVYGIAHNQITARICVEYFTLGHPLVFDTTDPTLLGLGWGVIATWWVGALLGIPLAAISRVGLWPKREPRTLIRPLGALMVATFAFALFAGVVGWIAAASGWVFLVGRIASRVPPDRHTPFLIDLWMHTASYLAGLVGGIVLMVIVLLGRQRLHFHIREPIASTSIPSDTSRKDARD